MKYTADTPLSVLIENEPEKAESLMTLGMHCVTCFAATGETIGQACEVHGYDVEDILSFLNVEEENKESKKD